MTDNDGVPVEVAALLTSANLHKINGDWDAALADASSALQMEPNNPEITSLIGSIYQSRGNPSEALVWYRMAAEQDPTNALYAARIQQMDKQSTGKQKSTSSAAGSRSRNMWLMLIAGGVVLLLLVLMLVVNRSRNRQMDVPPVPSKKSASKIETPQSDSNSGSENNVGAEQDLAGNAVTSTKPRTKAEIDINSSVSDSDLVRKSGVVVDDTIADPRTGQAIVTCSTSGGPEMTKSKLLSAAYAIAQASFKASMAVKTVTVRCVLFGANRTTSTQIVFVGDVSRTSIESLPESPDETQIQAVFTQVWWNPQIR